MQLISTQAPRGSLPTLHHLARRQRAAEVAGVHLVERGVIVHVAHEDRHLHHVLEVHARLAQHSPEVVQDLRRLVLHVALDEPLPVSGSWPIWPDT